MSRLALPSGLKMRLAVVPWLLLSFCLTGCPLSDHYSLLPDASGGADSGTDGGASAAGGSESAGLGGFSGDLSGNGSTLAGSPSGGAPSAGNGGSSGNPGAGSDAAGSGGSTEAGAPDAAGSAGQSPSGGGAGLDGTGGTSGSSGSSGDTGMSGTSGAGGSGPTCSVSSCNYSCCGSSCVDMTRDFQNCGACGALCNAPRTCMSSTCTSGWVSMSPPPLALGFVARWRAASVAMGKSVFIWGGSDSSGAVLDSGAIYNPMDDSWVAVTKDANTPTARIFATAVWTGSVVVVLGGSDATGATPYKDAAFYDPVQKAWSPLPAASKARSSALGFWDGTRAVFWGGIGSTAAAVVGADRFDPILLTSTASSATGDPGAILSPASGWDGSTLYLEGGQLAGARTANVSSYNSNSDTWSVLSKSLSARSNAFGVWDGARFVVWGGRDDFNTLHSDGKYQSGANWYAMAATGQPSMRMAVPRRQGWIFETSPGLIALFGGQTSLMGQGTFTNTGATYDVVNAKWGNAASWPSAETHDYGVGVWTGEEFVLWGGRNGAGATPASTLTGERWKP